MGGGEGRRSKGLLGGGCVVWGGEQTEDSEFCWLLRRR
jgi:hypothetical protein